MRLSRRLAVLCSLVALTGAIAGAQNPRDSHNPGPEHFSKRVVASGLGNPWEVTWEPDGFLWVTERTAFHVTRINPADGATHVALTIDDAFTAVDQDGLVGMALHPDLLCSRGRDFVYLAYVYDADPGRSAAGEPVEYFKLSNRYRDMAFSPDGRRLFLSTDDHGATQDGTGNRTDSLENPGAILEFTFSPAK